MKAIISFLLLSFSITVSSHAQSQSLTTPKDSLSYSLGILVGKNLRQGGFTDIDLDIFMKALGLSIRNEVVIMSDQQCEQFIQKGSTQNNMKQFESNKIAGEEFLAKNKTKPGVIALDNGLQYEVLKMGDGAKPIASDEVIVHYHGTLIDGTTFDSSVDRGETISFPLNRVISGWTEILQLMPIGSKWRVYIPYQMAYGDRPAGPKIQPYSALVFEIELFGIK